MMDWRLFELEHMLRQVERQRHWPEPLAPPRPHVATLVRQRLARGLVSIGLLLDAEASRAAAGAIEVAPRLNGNHA